MMMLPRRKNEFDLLEEMFTNPFLLDASDTKLMRSDIKEKENNYLIDIDLPGYDKQNIEITVDNGYLVVNAKVNKEDEKEEGKYVHKERYYGECSRSFYIGEDVKYEDIKANFKNGILKLVVPKKNNEKQIEERKYIQIED